MSINPTKQEFNIYFYSYQKDNKTKHTDQEVNAFSRLCNYHISNNRRSTNRHWLYSAVGLKIIGVDTRLLWSILHFNTYGYQLQSLAQEDFEKIKQAFHKYLPSASNRNLDRIDLGPLQFKWRSKVRYKISPEMREIIRDGVDRIVDAILKNRNMKESQDAVSRKTNRETVKVPMSTHDNSNQGSLVEHQPKKAKTAVQVSHEFAHDPFWFEEAFGLETTYTKTTPRNDQSSSTQEAAPLDILLFPADYDVFPLETTL